MDRTKVRMTTFEEADEAFCLNMTADERVAVLEDLNRRARRVLGYPEGRMERRSVRSREGWWTVVGWRVGVGSGSGRVDE